MNDIVTDLWIKVDKTKSSKKKINHIRITQDAFPLETEKDLNKFLNYIENLPEDYATILKFSAFAILEQISYTRKDGQYLRWDQRANRSNSKGKFNKGKIYSFRESVDSKLAEILIDINPNLDANLFSNDKLSNSTLEMAEFEVKNVLQKLKDLKSIFDYTVGVNDNIIEGNWSWEDINERQKTFSIKIGDNLDICFK